ncbi:protein HtrL [Folsomia candida]|uniref:Protein HtrL n=1 Tax=Folsomia candida TaxID=158441 RepID=A0A226DQA8_FOLCA|nr:protein HtrL [Folsomia candida]OXA47695.1 Protein HtrL [Folsomia candida]
MTSKNVAYFLSVGTIGLLIYVMYGHDLIFSKPRLPLYLIREETDRLNKLHVRWGNHSEGRNYTTTLVTAFFGMEKAKHSLEEYKVWLKNFLGQVDTPIVIFTQPKFKDLMVQVRNGRPTHFVLYNEIWDVPWLLEPHSLHDDYHKMHAIDPERSRHSPELYAVWNSKPWFLQTMSELNPFNSTYFYWMDVGCVRESDIKLGNYPNLERSLEVFGEDERSENYKKLNIFTVGRFPNYKPPPDSNTFEEMAEMDFVIGTFFGGTVYSINWFSRTFYAIHDVQLSLGEFVGKDQTLYNWIATQYPDRFRVVCSCQQILWNCRSGWFYFQEWYAGEDVANEDCRSAPVSNMTDFLLLDDD